MGLTLSRKARYMTLEACQGRINIRYGKAFGPLELSIRRKEEQASLPKVWVPDLDDRFLSGNWHLDSVTKRRMW